MNPAIEFLYVRFGELFHLDGEDYVKISARTARMLSSGKVFYMKKYEPVHIIAN